MFRQIMLLFGGRANCVLLLLLFLFVFALFFPVENFISKVIRSKVSKISVLGGISLVLVSAFFRKLGIGFLFDLVLLFLCFFGFLFGFLSNKRHIYLAIAFILLFVPLFFVLGFTTLTDLVAMGVYLVIGVGVFKALFYEKMYK